MMGTLHGGVHSMRPRLNSAPMLTLQSMRGISDIDTALLILQKASQQSRQQDGTFSTRSGRGGAGI